MKHNRKIYLPLLCMILILACVIGFFFRPSGTDADSAEIPLEEARKIALGDAGKTRDQVTFTKAKSGTDTGTLVYEFEFYTDDTSYRYAVSAETGSIRDREILHHRKGSATVSENENRTTSTESISGSESQPTATEKTPGSGGVIGVKEAQSVALQAAGLREEDVTFTECKLKTEDGRSIYEIEFFKGHQEYEYDVDAISGAILDWEIETEEELSSP